MGPIQLPFVGPFGDETWTDKQSFSLVDTSANAGLAETRTLYIAVVFNQLVSSKLKVVLWIPNLDGTFHSVEFLQNQPNKMVTAPDVGTGVKLQFISGGSRGTIYVGSETV